MCIRDSCNTDCSDKNLYLSRGCKSVTAYVGVFTEFGVGSMSVVCIHYSSNICLCKVIELLNFVVLSKIIVYCQLYIMILPIFHEMN